MKMLTFLASLLLLTMMLFAKCNGQCPDSSWLFSRDNCYKVFKDKVTWAEAESKATQMGAVLCSIADEAEWTIILGLICDLLPSPVAFGAYERYWVGHMATRQTAFGGTITGSSNTDGTMVKPYADGFKASKEPRRPPYGKSGEVEDGVSEPKVFKNANCGCLIRNDRDAGYMAFSPCPDADATIVGSYVAKMKPVKEVAITNCEPAGWIGLNGRCYGWFDGPLDVEEAMQACQAKGASLATARTKDESVLMKGMAARRWPNPVDSEKPACSTCELFTRLISPLFIMRDANTNEIMDSVWLGSTDKVAYGNPKNAKSDNDPYCDDKGWPGAKLEPKKAEKDKVCVNSIKNKKKAGCWATVPCKKKGAYICSKPGT